MNSDCWNIKLFSNNGKHYFYSANTNNVFSIPSGLYNEMQAIMSGHHVEISEDLRHLIGLGYIKSRIKKVTIPMAQYWKTAIMTKCNQIILEVTQTCNLKCRYCNFASGDNKLNRSHKNISMDITTAKVAIDFAIMHGMDSPSLLISFYGGEPFLNFQLIKETASYTREIPPAKRISFSMTSNLTIMNEEIAHFLIDNQVDLLVSLDGPESIHDSHRRFQSNGEGTFKTVFDNLLYLRNQSESYFNSRVSFNAVQLPFEDSGTIKEFFSQVLKCNAEQYRIVNADLSYIDYWQKEGDSSHQEIDPEFQTALQNQGRVESLYYKAGQCTPGVNRVFVNTVGDLFPCEKMNTSNSFGKIGSIFTGYDENALTRLSNLSNTIGRGNCRNCWAIRLCSICAGNCDCDGQNIEEYGHQYCNMKKKMILSQLTRFVEENKNK